MTRFTLFDATDFRDDLQNKFNIYTHFHDQCGGGFSFSYDEPLGEEERSYIESYFSQRGIDVQFSEDSKYFIMRA